MKETTKLERLLNKEFIYKQENIRVKDYFMKDEDKMVHIITDKNPIKIKQTEIDKFCSDLLPVEESHAISTEVLQQASGLFTTLQQTLLENIEQVKKNKDYVGQAKMVNSSVNTLIGMARLQIDVAKMKNK